MTATITPIRSFNPYKEPPFAWRSDARLRIAGHDLAIEECLAEIGRLECRIAELVSEGATEETPVGDLAMARMRLRSAENAVAWNMKETRSRRKDAGMEPHVFDRLPMAAE